jgi:peptide/nickel transport system permease protein
MLASVPVILMVALITFSLLHLAPGDPAAIIAGDLATPEDVAAIRRGLGLDKPFVVQFGIWLKDLFQGDLGTSIFSKRPITTLMAPRIQPTLSLAILSITFSTVVGILLGLLAAWRAGRLLDRGIMVFAVAGFSVPVFWLGFLLIWAFAVRLDLFPSLGYVPISEGLPAHLRSMTLPVLANAIPSVALVSRMTRSAMLEVLREDYIRTARAKGLTELVVHVRHALRAASIPIVTVVGLIFAGLIAGQIVTETVFSIPGLGRLIVDAVIRRDYPIVQAMLMVVSIGYVFVNLVVDIVYAYLDPRVRY